MNLEAISRWRVGSGSVRSAMRQLCCGFIVLISCQAAVFAQVTASATPPSAPAATSIDQYIHQAWNTLSRSMTDCNSLIDPKLKPAPVLYIPQEIEEPPQVAALHSKCNVDVERLPKRITHIGEIDPRTIKTPGLLYLPNKYVVPGGRFNEMYGWDSYFIVRGLAEDERTELARGMVENFFFEIEHYGAVLNANRTYYLTRSQPPFLTSMILAVYDAEAAKGQRDNEWLARAYDYAVRDHSLWVSKAHLAGSTGLSRYFDFGNGPAPESVKDETSHYRQVAAYFLSHRDSGADYVIASSAAKPSPLAAGPLFALQICDDGKTTAQGACDPAGTVALSADYYKGDRAMRESGFDISFRFGPYGAASHHYAPVCLNSLLYKSEKDLEHISEILGKKADAEKWREEAEKRKDAIQKYLWDADRGMYFDYDFEKQERSTYEYVTTFYPLWAGLASPDQARRVLQNIKRFERPGGLAMSPYETGGQWDYPYAWAPCQLLAVEGMRRAGYNEDADRVSYEFLSMVLENFQRDGTIREKYDAVKRSSETQVTAGYHMNIVGFGWTNGVFLALLHELPAKEAERLGQAQEAAATSVTH